MRLIGGNSRDRRRSIAARLYFVVGIMGLLIILELLTLRFAMGTLSAVRAFVGGESLWSKAQKNAAFSLQRYAATRDERDYDAFLRYLSIPEGDHIARLELFNPTPDMRLVRRGFLQGHIHPDDIVPMVQLLQRFSWVSHLHRAIVIWGEGDQLLRELEEAASAYHEAVREHDSRRAALILDEVKLNNEKMTVVQENFSNALGEGSRFLEYVVLFVLTVAVITVESVGISLAFLTARSLSRGLGALNRAAHQLGAGDFNTTVFIPSRDELGELAEAVNRMGALLKGSYGELEARVRERTEELARLANENARLFQEATVALRKRDEFLSLASHELKTPLTSMLLQAQMLQQRKESHVDPAVVRKFSHFMERQLLRLNSLVEEMLDTSRVDLSKLALNIEMGDLSLLVLEVCDHYRAQFLEAGMELIVRAEDALSGKFDCYRMEQVLANLLSNALKYAPGRPVRVSLGGAGDWGRLVVEDEGPGIRPEDLERVFQRFERGSRDQNVSGLGIGLYIAKSIMVAHGGRISVENGERAGVRFVVELPLGSSSGSPSGAKPL